MMVAVRTTCSRGGGGGGLVVMGVGIGGGGGVGSGVGALDVVDLLLPVFWILLCQSESGDQVSV